MRGALSFAPTENLTLSLAHEQGNIWVQPRNCERPPGPHDVVVQADASGGILGRPFFYSIKRFRRITMRYDNTGANLPRDRQGSSAIVSA